MRILVVHQAYRQHGGEDEVVEREVALLRRHGLDVAVRRVPPPDARDGIRLARDAVWSSSWRRQIGEEIERRRIDVTHFHNTFPLVSPSVYSACVERGVAVVQTIHNFRWLCPAATLYRDGAPCEACVKRFVKWPAVAHACYRGSRPESAVVVTMLAVHRLRRTLWREVDVFVSPTKSVRDKLAEGGLPPHRIVVKPHFSERQSEREGERRAALFVGRLSEEKGLRILVEAWSRLGGEIPLRIYGAGPLEGWLRDTARETAGIEVMGFAERDAIRQALADARFVVVPSTCSETFGLAAIEAFAAGVPVIASRIGGLAEIVADGRTGLLARPGDANDLAERVRWLWSHPEASARMGDEARREHEATYSPERNHSLLASIYERAIESARGRR